MLPLYHINKALNPQPVLQHFLSANSVSVHKRFPFLAHIACAWSNVVFEHGCGVIQTSSLQHLTAAICDGPMSFGGVGPAPSLGHPIYNPLIIQSLQFK